jgi:hypothetical protein
MGYLDAWIEAAGISDDNPIPPVATPPSTCCHTSVKSGGTLEYAQQIAHESLRTTKPYDRTSDGGLAG